MPEKIKKMQAIVEDPLYMHEWEKDLNEVYERLQSNPQEISDEELDRAFKLWLEKSDVLKSE